MNKKSPVQEESMELFKPKSVEELRKEINALGTGFDADYVLRKANKEREDMKEGDQIDVNTNLYKSMTLFEFDRGILLLSSISEIYRIFALEFSKNLQKEYNCVTPSEKSLAEVVVLNFVRVLQIQTKLNNQTNRDSINQIVVNYSNLLSKELDRAERHYLTSLQTLKMLKTPTLAVNIKTQTAIVGQNQVVQSNNQNDKAI